MRTGNVKLEKNGEHLLSRLLGMFYPTNSNQGRLGWIRRLFLHFDTSVNAMSGDFTQILVQAQDGDADAKEKLFDLIKDDLRQEAERLVWKKGPFAEAASLVNEAYLRLYKPENEIDLKNRRYFFTAFIDQMTKVLDERIRKEVKRPAQTALDEFADQILQDFENNQPFKYEEMRDALKRLKRSRNKKTARRHHLIELHYVGGLTVKDAAKVLEISYSQARDDKRVADAELYLAIKSRQE